MFSARSDKYTGTVTLDKPTVTVGEVPNRSSLSYQADNMGADGLIYNGVYIIIIKLYYPLESQS